MDNPQNRLSYESKVSDVLATEDGQNLGADTAQKHTYPPLGNLLGM